MNQQANDQAVAPASVLFTTIRTNRQTIDRLIESLSREQDVIDLRGAAAEVRMAISAHLAAMETTILPILRTTPLGGPVLTALGAGHQRIRAALRSIESIERADSPAVDASVEPLRRALREQALREEREVFPYAVRELAGTLESLAFEFSHALQKARGADGV